MDRNIRRELKYYSPNYGLKDHDHTYPQAEDDPHFAHTEYCQNQHFASLQQPHTPTKPAQLHVQWSLQFKTPLFNNSLHFKTGYQ